ncbi:MAG: phosphoribosylformylglycinamidine cyclo-ligase [Vicinamibacterales bacterium]
MDYKTSGVDISAGHETVNRIKGLAKRTFTPGVLSAIGSFGGLFRLGTSYRDPVLVSSADGVGTKLKVAFMTGRHDTVGQCLVNHCVNDILVQGAEPLFFLDYLATGALSPEVAAQVVEGVSTACLENGCALIGGETAEMPGFYAAGEYDIAGFIVGVVERDRLVTGAALRHGDVLLGLRSTGLHTNGYSLARAIVFGRLDLAADSVVDELGCTIGSELLRVHRSYLPVVRPLLEAGLVKGLAHITGGGITDNLPRILPPGTAALVDKSAWTPNAVFRFLQRAGSVPEDDMYRTFNMGIGMILGCAPDDADRVTLMLQAAGETRVHRIGRIVEGEPGVVYGSP